MCSTTKALLCAAERDASLSVHPFTLSTGDVRVDESCDCVRCCFRQRRRGQCVGVRV